MMLKTYVRGIYSVLFVGLLASYGFESQASAPCPCSSYSMYALPAATIVIVGGAISLGWHWCTSQKIERVAVDVLAARNQVSAVYQVQTEHTQRLEKLQTSADGNFKALSADLGALKDLTDKGLKELRHGQKELQKGQSNIMHNVDSVRGHLDRRFDEQAQEIAQLKAMIEQLRAQGVAGPTIQEAAASKNAFSGAKEKASTPFVHQSLFS